MHNSSPYHNQPADPSENIKGLEKKPDGFKVPDGYFDTLPSRVADSIRSLKDQQPAARFSFRNMPLRRLLIPVLTAGVLLALFLVLRPVPRVQDPSASKLKDTLDLEAAYDASYAADVQTADYLVTEELLEENGENLAMDLGDSFYLDEEVDDDAIIQYLTENEMDSSLLAEL